jgi:hypothetical protein
MVSAEGGACTTPRAVAVSLTLEGDAGKKLVPERVGALKSLAGHRIGEM